MGGHHVNIELGESLAIYMVCKGAPVEILIFPTYFSLPPSTEQCRSKGRG